MSSFREPWVGFSEVPTADASSVLPSSRPLLSPVFLHAPHRAVRDHGARKLRAALWAGAEVRRRIMDEEVCSVSEESKC